MKHVLVTGGAKGIGRAIVEELAGGDYKITATYNSSKASATEIKSKFPNVDFVPVNLEDRQAVDMFIKETVTADPIDVLINNAGVYIGKSVKKLTEAELYQQVDLLFGTPARLIQGLLPSLQKTKNPLIINISSQAVQARLTGEAVYSAAKSAISTLSYVLRAELNPEGIRVTALEPYAVNTYGMKEPSNMLLATELAELVLYVIELPPHIQIDVVSPSHVNQTRPDFPDWVEK